MLFSIKLTIIAVLAMSFVVSTVRCNETREERNCKIDIDRVFLSKTSADECIRYAFGYLSQEAYVFVNNFPKKYANLYYHHLYSFVKNGDVKSLGEFSIDVARRLETKYGTTKDELIISGQLNDLSDVADAIEHDYLSTLKYILNTGSTYSPQRFVRQRKGHLENLFGNTPEEGIEHAYFNETCMVPQVVAGFKLGYLAHIMANYSTKPENQMINPNDYCKREYGAQ